MSERCPVCNSPDPKLHPAVQHEGEVSICCDRFHSIIPVRSHPTKTPAIASEINRALGQVEALRYVDRWIAVHMSKNYANESYIAGLKEIQINVQAAVDRIGKGEPMESSSECCGMSIQEWYEGFSQVAKV